MSHEQSETFQGPDGKWYLTYGANTAVPGRRIPLSPGFPTPQAVDPYAAMRSRNSTPSQEIPFNVQRSWERVAGDPDIRDMGKKPNPFDEYDEKPANPFNAPELATDGPLVKRGKGVAEAVNEFGLLDLLKYLSPRLEQAPAFVTGKGDVKTLPSPKLPPAQSVLPLLFGGVAGLRGALARIGSGGLGGMMDEKRMMGGLAPAAKTAAIEAAVPAMMSPLRIVPGVRNMLPQHPAISETTKTSSHVPWHGQTMQVPGPQPSPILNPAGQPAQWLPAPPAPVTGPYNMAERTVTQPAQTYAPNIPPQLRALIEYLANPMGRE